MSRHGKGGDAEPSGSRGAVDSGRGSDSTPDPGAGPDAAPADEVRRRRQILLLLVGIILATVLALAALFFLGTRLSLIGTESASSPAVASASAASATPTPARTPTPTPTPTPTVRPAPGGPVAPGIHAWDGLGGGECIDPYPGPWAEEYTVVDCGAPHPAQLVARAPFPADAAAIYPGAEVIAAQLGLLCGSPAVFDTAAAAYPDLRIEGAYPATAEQWDAGQRDYFCFVSRASGEPLTGSLAAAP